MARDPSIEGVHQQASLAGGRRSCRTLGSVKPHVWRERSNIARVLAGLLSLLLSFGALRSLSYGPRVSVSPAPRGVSVTLLVSPRQAPVPPKTVPPAVSSFVKEQTAVKRSAVPTRAPPDAPVERRLEIDATPVRETEIATAASAPASNVPLRVDSQAIRKALAGTTGQIRKLAERGDVELDSPREGQLQVIGASVARAAKPECLAPNKYGSLLSLPLIAARAIQGKCK